MAFLSFCDGVGIITFQFIAGFQLIVEFGILKVESSYLQISY